MRFHRLLLASVCAMLLAAPAHTDAQHLITTYGGDRFFGTVTTATSDSVSMHFRGDAHITLNRGIVRDIEVLRDTWGSLGFSFGTPGALNFIGSWDFDGPYVRATLGTMFGQGTWGGQLNLGWSLSHSPSFTHHLSLGVTHSSLVQTERTWFGADITRTKQWDGVGGFYDLNWRGFFLEAGLSVGSGNFSSPQLELQLGYVYQFDLAAWHGR